MSRLKLRGLTRRRTVSFVALAALTGGIAVPTLVDGSAGAAPGGTSYAKPLSTSKLKAPEGAALKSALSTSKANAKRGAAEPDTSDLPQSGPVSVLVQLTTPAATDAYRSNSSKGRTAAKNAAKAQIAKVRAAQRAVTAKLPSAAPGSKVLYGADSALAAVAVRTDAKYVGRLRGLSGVKAVYPIVPKTRANSSAIPLLGTPAGWQATGDTGQNATIGVIDSGIDYTHADFGGAGTTAAYNAAKANVTGAGVFPTDKVIGGFDFAGDNYNADPNTTDETYPYNPVPQPDTNPLDCNSTSSGSTVGHGTHVAGTVGGYGVNADGSTYTGAYNSTTPFSSLKIGPGVAPKASLYALRVFGCAGSTNVVGEALEYAADPNNDGDPSDRLDVVNMSLGSDYGSPQDGDSVLSNSLAALGTVVVASIGNGGDLYDVGGSPGNATRVLGVAGSDDGFAVLDALRVTAPGALAGDKPGLLSVLYDYRNDPGISGGVIAAPLETANADGCDAFSPADAAKVNGKVALLYANGFTRCGSIGRTGNAEAAGAIGVVIIDDNDLLETGINGNENIPAILITKTDGDAIAAQAANNVTVTFGNATRNAVKRARPQDTDKVYSSSSRGTHVGSTVKPDVTAVGVSVFSVDVGTGNDGKTLSGTSMASPQVAGLAGLVRSQHPDWTTEEVKAAIMNTADKDIYTGDNRTGDIYAPNRVGAGRVDAQSAVANQVVAYVVDRSKATSGPGAVSVSFGEVPVTTPTATLTKTVRVLNKGLTPTTYSLAYQAITSVPGVSYSVSPSTVRVGARSAAEFTVTMTANRSQLTKTKDPTVEAEQEGLPRQFLADASGRVVLTASGRPSLRVPVYSAPRPASAMTTPAQLKLPNGAFPQGALPLQGVGVDQGTDATQVTSLVSGYELAGSNGKLPACQGAQTTGCILNPDEGGVDLKYVGATSDAPRVAATGADPYDPNSTGFLYFAVSSWGLMRTPAGLTGFEVAMDTDRNGTVDAYLDTTSFAGTDVFVAALYDADGNQLDANFLNVAPGTTDTDIFDTDSLVLPVSLAALPNVAPGHTRINYAVYGLSGYRDSLVVDSVGVGAGGRPALSIDVNRPALTASDGASPDVVYADLPGSNLLIRKDVAAYKVDKAQGLLLIHHHNVNGARAQVVKVTQPATVQLKLSRTTMKYGTPTWAYITIPPSAGPAATGRFWINRLPGVVLYRGATATGSATVPLKLPKGRWTLYVDYGGDGNYTPGRSNSVVVTVT